MRLDLSFHRRGQSDPLVMILCHQRVLRRLLAAALAAVIDMALVVAGTTATTTMTMANLAKEFGQQGMIFEPL